MQEHDLITAWLEKRFGSYDESYGKQWQDRFAGLECETLIPWQMDRQSRIAWGKVTGRKYGLVRYNFQWNPTFGVIDLTTGKEIGQTGGEEDVDGLLKS